MISSSSKKIVVNVQRMKSKANTTTSASMKNDQKCESLVDLCTKKRFGEIKRQIVGVVLLARGRGIPWALGFLCLSSTPPRGQ